MVGGGHNGLTTAAYLARAGLRGAGAGGRSILGGACVTDEVWPVPASPGPATWSRCCSRRWSPTCASEFGYRALPLDPAYAALSADGPIFFFNEAARTAASIAAFSKRDGEAYEDFEDLLTGPPPF